MPIVQVTAVRNASIHRPIVPMCRLEKRSIGSNWSLWSVYRARRQQMSGNWYTCHSIRAAYGHDNQWLGGPGRCLRWGWRYIQLLEVTDTQTASLFCLCHDLKKLSNKNAFQKIICQNVWSERKSHLFVQWFKQQLIVELKYFSPCLCLTRSLLSQ